MPNQDRTSDEDLGLEAADPSSSESEAVQAKGYVAELGAWLTSLTLHLAVLIVLAAITFALPHTTQELALLYEEFELPEEVEPLPQEFLSSDEPMEEYGSLSQAGLDSAQAMASVAAEQSLVIYDPEEITDFGDRMTIELDEPIFEGPEVSNDLPVQGMSHVGTTGALGAIDRLTHEILDSVEQQPTLVVWLFDQSGSMREERERVLARFDTIYDQLGVIEAAKIPAFEQHKDKPLLTAVVGFAAEPTLLTKKATDELDEIKSAVGSITDADTPVENVFQAIAWTANKFRSYRSSRQGGRNVMIIVFTDEAGDDVSQLDETVHLCRTLAMPVYVVGRPAPFGRRHAYVKWIDPDPRFDQRPQQVPVSMGPESLMPERLRLQFFGSERNEEMLDSGFGPYGLTRLCYETGGLYFAAHPNRTTNGRVSRRDTSNLAAHFTVFFEPDAMRRYQPNYVSTNEYLEQVRSNPARRALMEAAELSWTTQMENIQMRFVKRDEAALASSLSTAQRAAAIRQPQIDRICQILLSGEEGRESLKEVRWQAGYDLALGRALATKVRTDGYNTMLALAKQGMAFKQEKNNTWILRTGTEFANSSQEKMAARAQELLQRVKDEHEGTPWAYLADRELRAPLGWKWDESYTFVPDLRQVANNNNNARPRPPRNPAMRQRPPRRDPPPL